MSVINKELYDALIEANVSEPKATAAAKSDTTIKEDIADIKARLALVEKLQWGILLSVVALLAKAIIG